jgi:Cu2+-exporting ATPase
MKLKSQEIEKLVILESISEHPLAKAIIDHFNGKVPDFGDIDFLNIPGSGIKGTIKGMTYYSGSKNLVSENKLVIDSELLKFEQELLNDAYTIAYFGNEKEVICIMGIKDSLREGVDQAIREVKDLGVEVSLLSGDNEVITRDIALKLNIEHYQGNVLPGQKGAFIRMLKGQGKIVAMAGDGINDAEALAEADIGIAMGSGTDIAMETAGITLMRSDIQHIRSAVLLSRATVKTIHQNLFWAFAYNVLAIPIAAGILYPFTGFLLNPMIAGAAMAFSSVSVVVNSLRLKGNKIN